MDYVRLEDVGNGTQVLTWSDPDRLNALTQALAEDFSNVVLTIKKSPPRVIVVTGKGNIFSSGGDNQLMLRNSTVHDPRSRNLLLRNFFAAFLSLLKLKIPIIAAINGEAIGPGLFLACACDYRVADETARMGTTSLKFGRYPVLGATLTLPALVGPGQALELFCGKLIDAPEAHRIGLIEKLAAPGHALEEALITAQQMVQAAPFSLRLLLDRLRPDEAAFAAAIRHETDALTQALGRGDYQEAHQAQLDGRFPKWVPR
jgi:enoyl-CoA hydratase